MATYYIGATGSDANDGSEATPWLNLSHARLNSITSDTIVVLDGVAVQTAGLSDVSLGDRIITSQSGNAANAVIDFNGNTFERVSSGVGASISNITMKNMVATATNRGSFTGFSGEKIEGVIFEDCVTTGSDSGAAFRTGFIANCNTDINNCIFRNIRVTSIAASGGVLFAMRTSSNLVTNINNCTIYGDSVDFADSTTLEYIAVLRPDSTNTLTMNFKNTIVSYPNGLAGGKFAYSYPFSPAGSSGVFNVINSDIHNCDYELSDIATDVATITTDPLFVDADNGDFRLRPQSPCIGGGTIS